MKRQFMIFALLLLVVGGALFYRQIFDVFDGMTPLESMQFIANYVLHVTVVTVCAFVVFGIPKLVQPWLRMLRWKHKQRRRERGGVANNPRAVKLPRVNRDALLMAFLEREMQKQQNQRGRRT